MRTIPYNCIPCLIIFKYSKIEIERIFHVVVILTSLQRCQFRVQNLDNLVIILKNWPNDARIRCILASKGMENFFAAKDDLFDDFEDELKEGGYFEDDSQNP